MSGGFFFLKSYMSSMYTDQARLVRQHEGETRCGLWITFKLSYLFQVSKNTPKKIIYHPCSHVVVRNKSIMWGKSMLCINDLRPACVCVCVCPVSPPCIHVCCSVQCVACAIKVWQLYNYYYIKTINACALDGRERGNTTHLPGSPFMGPATNQVNHLHLFTSSTLKDRWTQRQRCAKQHSIGLCSISWVLTFQLNGA